MSQQGSAASMIPPDAKRIDAVPIYYKCLLMHSPRWSGWERLNAEIIERWSLSGLRYIKERAWNGN